MKKQENYRACLSNQCDYCTELTFTLGSCSYPQSQLGKHHKSPMPITLRDACYYNLSPFEQSLPKFTEGPCLPSNPEKQAEQDQETYHTCPGDAPFNEESTRLSKIIYGSALEDIGILNFL